MASFRSPNCLLSALTPEALRRISPHLTRVPLQREQWLSRAGEPVQVAHFPEGGVISCVALDRATRTEVGLIGVEGVTVAGAVLGDDISAFDTFVQVDGATALTIPLKELRDAMEEHASMRQTLGCYLACFLLQVSYGLVASAQHLMDARLARWLLMCHDRVAGDEIAITHEFLGLMIAAQRSGVTVTLHALEGAGMIRSTRGRVIIRDRAKLEEIAGDSYGIPEARYRELIAPFGKSSAQPANPS